MNKEAQVISIELDKSSTSRLGRPCETEQLSSFLKYISDNIELWIRSGTVDIASLKAFVSMVILNINFMIDAPGPLKQRSPVVIQDPYFPYQFEIKTCFLSILKKPENKEFDAQITLTVKYNAQENRYQLQPEISIEGKHRKRMAKILRKSSSSASNSSVAATNGKNPLKISKNSYDVRYGSKSLKPVNATSTCSDNKNDLGGLLKFVDDLIDGCVNFFSNLFSWHKHQTDDITSSKAAHVQVFTTKQPSNDTSGPKENNTPHKKLVVSYNGPKVCLVWMSHSTEAVAPPVTAEQSTPPSPR